MKAAGIAAAAALIAGGAAQAQQQARPTRAELFCHDLKRLVREAPDWVGMWNARPAPLWLGFRPGACRASAASGAQPASYWCHQHLAPPHLGLDTLKADIAACLPEAKMERGRWGRDATFTLPGLRILINESGGPGAKVGRIVGFRVEGVGSE